MRPGCGEDMPVLEFAWMYMWRCVSSLLNIGLARTTVEQASEAGPMLPVLCTLVAAGWSASRCWNTSRTAIRGGRLVRALAQGIQPASTTAFTSLRFLGTVAPPPRAGRNVLRHRAETEAAAAASLRFASLFGPARHWSVALPHAGVAARLKPRN
eukprot:362387-Chlamydomonas_euryale.AAC.10